MTAINEYTFRQKKPVYITDFLVCCLAFWPFLWNVWGIFKVSASVGISIPMYMLWGIAAVMVLIQSKVRKSFLFIWFIFLGVVLVESITRIGAIFNDLSVILCGVLFCILVFERKIDYCKVLKWLVICGLIISISILLDNTMGLFNEILINFYTDEAITVKHNLTVSGGLLPHTGSAGCFIYSGLAAYIALTKIKEKKLTRINSLVVIFVFVVAALLIQKRGFIIDVAIALIVIKVLQIKINDLGKIDIQRNVKRILLIIAFTVAVVFLYNKVPLIHDSFDSLIEKFTSGDDTYSGRTDLYELAFSLAKGRGVFGIGWGRYRLNTLGFFGVAGKTYAVHNVYIQLFCETGIMGLGAFLIAAVSTIVYGLKKYRSFIKCEVWSEEKFVVGLGLFMQLFFLTYCMSGNPLYDYNFCITYFIGIMLTLIPIGMERE